METETNVARELSFSEIEIARSKSESDNNNLLGSADYSEKCQEIRPETPLSDASTSGICSLALSDFDSSEESVADEKETNQKEKFLSHPVIIYEKRNILNVFENIYPYSVFQTTNVPKMNMRNYWERRSIYHRLGPYGKLDEIDFQKCLLCDFYTAVPKRV